MGLAASQARFLGLTARKTNNEYQAQQINQQRLNLAEEQEQMALAYQEKMNNRIMYFMSDSTNESSITLGKMKQLTYWNIVTPTGVADPNGNTSGLGFRLVDTNGDIVVPNYPADAAIAVSKYNVSDDVLKDRLLQENLMSGKWHMKAQRIDDDGTERWVDIAFEDAITSFIQKSRDINPDNPADEDYWCLFNKNVEQIDGKYQQLTYQNLTTMFDLKIRIYDSDEKIMVDKIPENDEANVAGIYNVDPYCVDPAYLEKKLREGEWFIQTRSDPANNTSDWATVPWQGIPNIYDALNSEDDAAAESEYEYLLSKFHKEDKMLELRLKQLETEHKAIETEMDSVSKVLQNNVEASFKTFA